MTGRYEGQQTNTEQDGEKLLRIMAMAAKAAGAQQVPADTRPAQANPGGMSEGDRMVSTARPGTGRDDPMQSLLQGDAGGSVPAGVAAETVIGPEEVAKAGEILQRYKTGKAALDKRIIENELWFRMGHWKNYQNKMMEEKPQPSSGWLFNSIANKHADAMDNYPEPNVLPRAADDEETARTLSKVIPAVLEQCNYEQVYSDTWWRKLKTGTGVKGIFWDPVLRGGLGDISIQSVNLLMLYWAPGVEDIQQSPHLFSLSLEDNEQLVGRFPQMEGHTGKGLDVGQYIHDDSIDTTDKSVVVDWYYKKAQPGGQTVLHYCKYCNGVVLYASENDPQLAQRGFYDHGKYPFVFDPLFMEEDSPAGFGCIDVMKDTQTAIDEMNHAMDENVKLAAKQRFVLSDTAGVNEKELADFSKDIVHVVGRLNEDSFRPLQTNVLSGNCMNYRDARVNELKEVSGNRDVSQGGTTSGLTAASAIAALQEAGSKLSRDMLKSAYRAFAKECYLIIELMRQFYDEQRVYRITGESGGVEYATFSAQMLRGVPGGVVGGVQLGDHEPVFDIVDGKMNLQYFAATEATAASGRNREPRLGPWPAGHECRSRHEVDAGSHNPFGGMDLQLFADGNAAGSAAAGEGGAEAAPAVQKPALRPAQERLARRSGALRGKASPAEQPPQLSGQPETQPQEGEKPTEEKPQEQKAEKTPEEKRKAFVAQVLGAANTASQKAKDAQSAADRAEGAAGEAQKAKAAAADSVQQAKGEAESAQTAAQQADKAAARAEGYAPKDGTVLSVNGKGGAVRLNAADVGAMAADRGDLVQQVVLEGRTLTVVFTDGTQQAYTTQDTTELTAMTGVLRTANGGTGLDRAITAADVGAVEKGSGDYLKGNRGNYRLRIEQRGEWKGLTVCDHWHTPGASAATLVENGVLTVPAAVTAVPGVGCITFEGTDGSCTVTSADVRCKVCANSGTAEGAMPAPATPAWEALVGMLGTGGITTAEKRAVLTVLRTLAAGNDAAAAACDRLEALWGADDPDDRNTARLSLAVLGRMILGRS